MKNGYFAVARNGKWQSATDVARTTKEETMEPCYRTEIILCTDAAIDPNTRDCNWRYHISGIGETGLPFDVYSAYVFPTRDAAEAAAIEDAQTQVCGEPVRT